MVFSGDAVFCQECNSDHVIQLDGQTSPASTAVPFGFNQNGDTSFRFDYIGAQKVYLASLTHFINALIPFIFIPFTICAICSIDYFSFCNYAPLMMFL